jgi:hypothetical protein
VKRKLRRLSFTLLNGLGLRPLLAQVQTRLLFGPSGVRGPGPTRALEELRDKEFVFIISYHKCGTRSVHALLEALGFQGIHWPAYVNSGVDYQAILRPMAADAELCVRALTPLLRRYDLFSDVPFPGLYRELHEHFPRSRFVLIRRDAESWWGSLVRQWHLSDGGHALDAFEAVQYRLPVGSVVTAREREMLIERMLWHNRDVQEHFRDSDRLFVGDLDQTDLGARLAHFVQKQAPARSALPRISQGSVYSRTDEA